MKKLQLISLLFSLILTNSLYATSSYQVNNIADLWQVAGQMRTDVTTTRQQILLGLLQTNPDVFTYPCNVFSIKSGSSVNAPDEATLQQINRISAIQQIGQQILAWDDHLAGRATLPCEVAVNTTETPANNETVAPAEVAPEANTTLTENNAEKPANPETVATVETVNPAPSATETAPEANATPTETSAEKPANPETVATVETVNPTPSTTETVPEANAIQTETSAEKPANPETVATAETASPAPNTTETAVTPSEKIANNETVATTETATPAPSTDTTAVEPDKTMAVAKEPIVLKPYTPDPFKPATPPSETTTEETPFAQVLTQITQFFTARSNEQFTEKQQYYLKQMFLFLFYAFVLAFVLRLIFIIKRYFRQRTEKRVMLKKQAIIQPT